MKQLQKLYGSRVWLLGAAFSYAAALVTHFLANYDRAFMEPASVVLSVLYLLCFYALAAFVPKARLLVLIAGGLMLAAEAFLILTASAPDPTWVTYIVVLFQLPLNGLAGHIAASTIGTGLLVMLFALEGIFISILSSRNPAEIK